MLSIHYVMILIILLILEWFDRFCLSSTQFLIRLAIFDDGYELAAAFEADELSRVRRFVD